MHPVHDGCSNSLMSNNRRKSRETLSVSPILHGQFCSRTPSTHSRMACLTHSMFRTFGCLFIDYIFLSFHPETCGTANHSRLRRWVHSEKCHIFQDIFKPASERNLPAFLTLSLQLGKRFHFVCFGHASLWAEVQWMEASKFRIWKWTSVNRKGNSVKGGRKVSTKNEHRGGTES